MKIEAESYQPAYVSFSAEINPNTTESLIATATQLVQRGHNQLYFLFSTPGGAVMNGINIYNVLRGLPAEIIFHNVGNVDSIGNAIFLSGDKRFACAHSTFMFHGVGFDLPPGHRLEQKNAQECLDGIMANQKRIADVLIERTNISATEALDLFKEARTKDASYAVAQGIVSEIRDVNIPAGTPIVSLVFQR